MSPSPSADPRIVPAAHGLAWLLQSLSLLRRQTWRLLLIALLMQFILGLTQLPLLGLLVVLSVPGLSAGLLECFHVAAGGGRPALFVLFKPLASSPHNGRLLALGALVFVVGVVSMSLLLSGSDELMDPALLERIEQGDLDAVSSINQDSLQRMAAALLVGVAVSGTLSYFAIPLIWFRGCKLGVGLTAGLRALFINWRAFFLLALGLGLVLVPVALASGFLFGLSGSPGLSTGLLLGIVMLLLLLFQLLLFGTQYCAFRDIFGLPSDRVAPPEDDEGQLVA
jgi:hypothetical protein